MADALAAKARDGEAGRLHARTLAAGEDWAALDILCTAGPRDRSAEEVHERSSVSVVLAGTFRYQGTNGCALMTPGAILLGQRGAPFACGHEHGEGDRCLSFQFSPRLLERVARDVGSRRATFATPRLPPSRKTAAQVARAALVLADPGAAEEVAVGLAAAALRESGEARLPQLASRDLARATAAARRMEAGPEAPHTISALSAEVGLSPYRFVRAFGAAVGLTPHQFLLRLRLQDAARRLLDGRDAVTSVAYDVGFEDLSNFTRAFRAEFGTSPRAWRASRGRLPPA